MNTNRSNYIIIILIFTILFLGIFSYITIDTIWQDEGMYISAGVLIQDNVLYKDFAYLQMPYLPIIYGMFYRLTGTSYYLLSAELFDFIFMILSTLLIYFISYRISKNIFVALTSVLLLVLNKIIIETMGYSANTMMPIMFSLMGFYLFIVSVSEKRISCVGGFFSGIALAIATGTKLYYAAMLPPFFFISLLFPRSKTLKTRIVKVFLPLMAGIMVGLVPAFYYLINDFDIFMFNNLTYHQLNTKWREMGGYFPGMSLTSKFNYGWRILAFPTNVALLIGSTFLFFASFSETPGLKDRLKRLFYMEGLLAIFLVFFTTVAAFTPAPLWNHYFALPIPFIIILISCWYNSITSSNRELVKKLLICLIFVSLFFGGYKLFRYVYQIQNINKWPSISLHHTAKQIQKHIGTVEKGQKIATLSPLYAIEAGLPIYKELSTGSFLYRIGDLIPDYKRSNYVCTSPNTLHNLFAKDPPKAILVGLNIKHNLDESFIKYAKENDYMKIQKNFDGLTLYVKKK